MALLNPPDFQPMLKTMISPFRSHLAGQPDYLDQATKNSIRQDLINELLPKNGKLKRYETWYLEYYMRPYMHKLTKNEFLRRWADILDNNTIITEENKISAVDVRKDDSWMIRFSELLAESQFRGGIPNNRVAYDTIMNNISLNSFSHPNKSVRELSYVFRFGQLAHLEQMKKEGVIRLANSRTYRSNSMNHGQKDDENNFTFTVFPELLNNLDGQTGLANIDPVTRQDIYKITHQHPQDYLMWCASHHYDFRIPHAFNAEAVAIITNPKKFKKDVSKALRLQNLYPTVRKVGYFDPYLDLETKLDVRFSKHFRFSYQNEFRVVAQGKNLPEYLFLTVPELPEYCDIHKLITPTPQSKSSALHP